MTRTGPGAALAAALMLLGIAGLAGGSAAYAAGQITGQQAGGNAGTAGDRFKQPLATSAGESSSCAGSAASNDCTTGQQPTPREVPNGQNATAGTSGERFKQQGQ